MKNKDIIIVSIQPWDLPIAGNSKNLAYEFSKNNRVLFVNYALDRITKIKERKTEQVQHRLDVIRGKEPDIIQENENLWVFTPKVQLESINWIKSKPIFRFLNKWNNARLSREIKSAIKRLNFADYILFNDTDIFRSYHLKELLNPKLYVYYIRDFIIAVDYWKHHGEAMQGELTAKSDVALTNSTYLRDYAQKFNKNSFYVGQGCDLTQFNPYSNLEMPRDMKNLSGPVIGYVGALKSLRLDISLLEYIAKSKPEWNLVLVGPEDDDFKKSNLHNIPNVKFLGAKHPDQLPAYIKSFDVCLNPQAVNPVTIGNYPRKIDEYLAMGKPVVATKTEAMSVFEEHTFLAVTNEDYVRLIDRALYEDSEADARERIEFASQHTWENHAEEIYKYSKSIQSKKMTAPEKVKSGLSLLASRIKGNEKLKKVIHRMLIPKNQARPRLWVRLFLNPIFHKRGKNSLVRRRTRMDVLPFNKFYLGSNSTIEDFSTINNGMGAVAIGDRVRVGISNTLIGPVTIKNDVIIAQNVVMSGLNHGYEDISIPPHKQKCSVDEIIIEDEVWIGANCVIVAGVKIGKHAVIAAGSVVTKDVPPYTVAAGNPAKILKEYDSETKTWKRSNKIQLAERNSAAA